jgi:hypothetical protein
MKIWLALCAALLVLTTALGLAVPHPVPGQFGIGYGVALDEFVALEMFQGAVYAAACWIILRNQNTSIWFVLGTAFALRLMVLVFPPFLSNDLYRYIWDGWVQNASINPYRYLPVDPHLAFLRDAAVYPNINRATYAHTIYPPAAELFFALSAAIDKLLHLPPILGLKLSILTAEAVGIAAMLHLCARAGLSRTRILIYAWNPVVIWEYTGNGHIDALAVCFIALALLAATTSRANAAMAALAAAVLTKFLPLILLPAIWRRWNVAAAALFAGLIIALYLPYLSVGTGVFGFLGGYTSQEHIASGSGIWLLSLIPLPTKPYFAALALLLLALGARIVFSKTPQTASTICKNASLMGTTLIIGLSPHYPWYFPFLLIPATITPSPAVLYLVTASGLLYLNPTHTGWLWPSLVFGPAMIIEVSKKFFFEKKNQKTCINFDPARVTGTG